MRFLVAIEMALQFDIDVFRAKQIEDSRIGLVGQVYEAFGEFGELFWCRGAFAFLGAHLHASDQAAEVLITGAAFG